MGVLKTFFVGLTLVMAGPVTGAPLPQVFAGCLGRYSAEVEHAWLMHDPAAEQLARYRARFEDLLDAVAPQDARKSLLDQRIRAKIAHAHMLSQAQFSRDGERARWARHRAATEIGYCASFLLES